jgi:cytidyltransferase-like protein
MKIALVTGGFDPIHSGHIALINDARQYADEVWVGINSDAWLIRKKGFAFMPADERRAVVESLRGVAKVIEWDDSDNSASGAILECIRNGADHVVFCNGGDRSSINRLPLPEVFWSKHDKVTFEFGVGGNTKKNSSSSITENFKAPKTERTWGYYRVIYEAPGVKVKELTVNPGASLSMQQHSKRSEFWLITSGMCVINTADKDREPQLITKHQSTFIPVTMWHQIVNPFPEPCSIVEIQYGSETDEEDIERWKS